MTDRPEILIVEDDPILADSLLTRLRLEGMRPTAVTTCGAALDALARRGFDAVVSDIRLPDGTGEALFWAERSRFAVTPTVFTTAFGDVEQAVRLVKLGAVDYLTKPYDLGALVALLRRVTRIDAGEDDRHAGLVATSAAMARILALVERAAATDRNVLLVGAGGTGKRTLARHVHRLSPRAQAPFVAVEGATLTAERGERILFGECAGEAPARAGLVDEAGEGTLLVSEIADIPAPMQGRLARFVDDRLYRPVGATAETSFRGRLVATMTVRGGEPAETRFDLADRFGVVTVHVPALGEREGDVPALARHFLREETAAADGATTVFSAEALAALEDHDWPGNLLELRNRVVRAVLACEGGTIEPVDLFPEHPAATTPADLKLEAARRDAERHAIETALGENDGRIVETAKALGISRVTLWSKMKRLGIARS